MKSADRFKEAAILTLYYSKNSSAIAAHILLEEVGVPYEAVETDVSSGAHQTPAFLALNPKGRIPALETPDGVITENPAILEYVAALSPTAKLIPDSPFAQAQARALAAYLCSTVHVALAHFKRPTRWADDPEAVAHIKSQAPQKLLEGATFLEQSLALNPWALGSRYSFCDPYLFLLEGWLEKTGSRIETLPRLQAHTIAMRKRPATRRVLKLYDLA